MDRQIQVLLVYSTGSLLVCSLASPGEIFKVLSFQGLDPDKFVSMVEDFATALVELRERLEGAHLSGDPKEVAESLGMEDFIRV